VKARRGKEAHLNAPQILVLTRLSLPHVENVKYPSEDIFCLCELLSCSEAEDIPVMIFSRASHLQWRWQSDGELAEDMDGPWVSASIIRLFQSKNEYGEMSKDIESAIGLDILEVGFKAGRRYISITEHLRDHIRQTLSSKELIIRRFDILSVVVQAFPDEYSEIVWEEIRLQMTEIVGKACLPLLRVISIKDIEQYFNAKEWQRCAKLHLALTLYDETSSNVEH
jgi:hypothetical protein